MADDEELRDALIVALSGMGLWSRRGEIADALIPWVKADRERVRAEERAKRVAQRARA